MTMITNNAIGSLTRYLDVVVSRQGVVAQNIANVDTPGYRTKDIDMNRELRSVDAGGGGKAAVREIAGLLQRPDGNNVSLDREALLMAETQLQFRTGVQLLRSEFRRILTAIQEGR